MDYLPYKSDVMQLELKHLAAYLPYGLKIKLLNYKCDYVGIEFSEANGYYMIGEDFYVTYNGGSTGKGVNDFKPILRPLMDLTKKELRKQGFSSHIDFLTHERMNPLGYDEPGYSHRSGCPLEMGLYLFSQHFDVFNLIPAGLAININV